MKLQQLRYLLEVSRQGLNVSAAAETLFTSQPGISKQIRLLEEELGVDVFVRNGKRVTGVTQPGRIILEMAERILRDAENLKQVGREFCNEAVGRLSLAVTHTQARYALPEVVRVFIRRYPLVRLSLLQGNPTQVAQMVISGEADIAIATESIDMYKELVTLPCHQWNRGVITPPGHPLLEQQPLSLNAIAQYPLITYDFAFAGRSKINKAFEARGLAPNIVLTALDSDVIKTYVELGLGVGIIARMAFDPERDINLREMDASHLFDFSTTKIGLRRGGYLRGYEYDFIELFAPNLSRKTVDSAINARDGRAVERPPEI
jgi:LysR family cys regulon transcriptional activator